jgi:hypothetical protein
MIVDIHHNLWYDYTITKEVMNVEKTNNNYIDFSEVDLGVEHAYITDLGLEHVCLGQDYVFDDTDCLEPQQK